MLMLAGALAQLVVGARAGRVFDVDEVTIRRARLRRHGPAATDPFDDGRSSELPPASFPNVQRRFHDDLT